jgi:hypothetical protein
LYCGYNACYLSDNVFSFLLASEKRWLIANC